jgi:hypothetical protein
MFSNKSSRSSSVHSLSEILRTDDLPISNMDPNSRSFDIGNDYEEDYDLPELSADNTMNPSNQLAFTKNHPMGQILLNLLKDMFTISKKTNVKEMDSEVNEMCTNFYNAMRMGKVATNRQIQRSAQELEELLIEKELNSHLLNESTCPPPFFSPVPSITTGHLRNEAMKCFPTRAPKFAGGTTNLRDGMDIIEFLSAMKTAQEYCKLSEKEFKQFLLLCTTGRAHALLSEWIELGESIPTIFHNLVMHFDRRLTPESAKELLFNYRAPKSLSLKEVETNIMLWVSRAATMLPAGSSRIAYYNMEIIQTLIRSLPPSSSARVQSVFNTLSARLGRAAQATELSRALNIDRHSIDLDIKRNGVDKHNRLVSVPKLLKKKPNSGRVYVLNATPDPRIIASQNRYINNQPRVYSTMVQGSHTTNRNNYSGNRQKTFSKGPNQNTARPSRPTTQNKNFRGSKNKNQSFRQTKHTSRDYCSLCGHKDHIASEDCPYMVSDTGAKVHMMPTHSTCALCPKNISPRLNHPSIFCPYRRGGPLSNSQ